MLFRSMISNDRYDDDKNNKKMIMINKYMQIVQIDIHKKTLMRILIMMVLIMAIIIAFQRIIIIVMTIMIIVMTIIIVMPVRNRNKSRKLSKKINNCVVYDNDNFKHDNYEENDDYRKRKERFAVTRTGVTRIFQTHL